MKYLKTWMGVSASTGVGMGDNGGYPEQKLTLIESIDELVDSYDPRAEYYKLTPTVVKPIVDAVKDLG